MKLIFIIGKGGVGKSTNSSILATKLAESGKKVVLISIDPAHNLHDIFQKKFGEKPKEVIKNLIIMEADLKVWIKKYLGETEKNFKSIYKYQEAFNLHKYFNTLKYSPGSEEYAVLLLLESIIKKYKNEDFIIMDTPPTALTLKFIALPKVSLLWLNELKKFREIILKKKDIISKIKKNGEKHSVNDPVLIRIEELISRNTKIMNLFQDSKKIKFILVLNPDVLSTSESCDICCELNSMGISVPFIILNKFNKENKVYETIKKEFDKSEIFLFYKTQYEIMGLQQLQNLSYPLDIAKL